MRFPRIGLIDISAVLVVVVAIVLPERGATVTGGYDRHVREGLEDKRAAIAAAQSELAVSPGDGTAADRLASLLTSMGQHDMALRAAGHAAAQSGPDAWRSHLAVSSTHAERIEIREAHRHGNLALEACRKAASHCPDYEEVRLRLYVEQLDAGLQALEAGVDPRLEPEAFRRKMAAVHPTARFRPVHLRGAGGDSGGDSSDDSDEADDVPEDDSGGDTNGSAPR